MMQRTGDRHSVETAANFLATRRENKTKGAPWMITSSTPRSFPPPSSLAKGRRNTASSSSGRSSVSSFSSSADVRKKTMSKKKPKDLPFRTNSLTLDIFPREMGVVLSRYLHQRNQTTSEEMGHDVSDQGDEGEGGYHAIESFERARPKDNCREQGHITSNDSPSTVSAELEYGLDDAHIHIVDGLGAGDEASEVVVVGYEEQGSDRSHATSYGPVAHDSARELVNHPSAGNECLRVDDRSRIGLDSLDLIASLKISEGENTSNPSSQFCHSWCLHI